MPALQQASLEAVRNALAIAPDLAAAHFLIASAQAERNDWVNAEASFRRAIERSTSPDGNFSFAIHLLSVGNFAEARELLEAARENDPLNQTLQGLSLLARGLLGDRVGAEEEYRRARLLFADRGFLGRFVTMTRLEPGVPVDPDAVAQRGPIHDEVLERIAAPDEALGGCVKQYSRTLIRPSHSSCALRCTPQCSAIRSSRWTCWSPCFVCAA